MKYIHAQNSNLIEYPYSIEKLRRDNPGTSFPYVMNNEELSAWGVYSVEEQSPPAYNEQKEVISLRIPELDSETGAWIAKWEKISYSVEDIERIEKAEASLVRTQRNELLQKTDHTQLNDFPCTEARKLVINNYRQALRDLPAQDGFPWDVVWPSLDEIE